MTGNVLVRLFEHNNWANQQIIQACSSLSDEQLDAEPQSATQGSIRSTLLHMMSSQQGYLNLLTLPLEERRTATDISFDELQQSAVRSGEGLLELARNEASRPIMDQLQTRDGYLVEPWVVMLQVINHATEHREQIKSMLSALGMTPPEIDGWDYGEAVDALVPKPA
jgi:uncharacterized damage-inducible protein DinB